MGTYIQHKLNEIFVENDFSDLDTSEPLPDEDHFGGYALTGKKANPKNAPNVAHGNIPYDHDVNETEIGIAYDYQPEEPRTYNYPGSDASLDIYEVWIESSKEIIEITDPKLLEYFEEIVWDQIRYEQWG